MGGQAQVVTFALDALLAQGETIDTVIVLHMSPEDSRVQRALSQLSAEFAGERYQGQPVQFRHLAVQAGGRPLDMIHNSHEAEAAWATGRDVLTHLKPTSSRMHICIAGGPRILALTITSAALLHCDHYDRLWHLYTPREFIEQARDGAILHAPPEAGVCLLRVPLVPWGAHIPALRQVTQPITLSQATTPDLYNAQCCAQVWEELSNRERQALEMLTTGKRPQEAADHLNITLKTLDSHKTKILAECRVAWNLPEDEHITYHFIREKFADWVKRR